MSAVNSSGINNNSSSSSSSKDGDLGEAAKLAYTNKNYVLAAKLYMDAALEANTKGDKQSASRYLNSRARALIQLQLFDDALISAINASQYYPSFSKPFFTIAQIYVHKNEYKKAKENAEISLNLAKTEGSKENIDAINDYITKITKLMNKPTTTTTSGAATIPTSTDTSTFGSTLLLKDQKYINDPLWQAYDISRLLTQSIHRGLEVHDRYYLVPDQWWQNWVEYTQYSKDSEKILLKILRTTNNLPGPNDATIQQAFTAAQIPLPGTKVNTGDNMKTKPGPIPTKQLIDTTSMNNNDDDENPTVDGTSNSTGIRVKESLRAEEDYQFIPYEAFQALKTWYGIDGPIIERFVVLDGHRTTIDVFPEKNRYQAASMDTDQDDVDMDNESKVGNVCANCGKSANQFCGNCREVFYCSEACQKIDYEAKHRSECRRTLATIDPTKVKLNGKVGLSNLGNTCFMNSSIQALSAVWPITELFLTGRWKADLNVNNPLGTKGKLVSAYAELLDELWRGKTNYAVAPSRVKQAVSGFQERFSGFAQHDAQELLGYVLDGLHEDLNRVKVKKYIEDEESNGRPDPEVAAASWVKYKMRNDSAIVDTFGGQFKNRLECPDCKRISVKFDPYNMVPLPVTAQTSNKRYVVVYVQRLLYDPTNPLTWRIPTKNDPEAYNYWSKPRDSMADYNQTGRLERYIFGMEPNFTIGELRQTISKAANIPLLNMEFEKVNVHNREMNDIYADLNVLPLDHFPDVQRGHRTQYDLVVCETAAPTWRQTGVADINKDISHIDPAVDYEKWKAELPLSSRILFLVDVRGFDSTTAYGRNDIINADSTYNQCHDSTKSLGPLLLSITRGTTVAQFRMIIARTLYPLMGANIKATMLKERALKAGVKESEVEPVADADVHLYIASNILVATHPSIVNNKNIKFLPGINEDGTDSDPENPASTTNFSDPTFFPIVELIERDRHHYDFMWSKAVVFARGARLTPFIDHKSISSYRNTPSAIKEEEGFIKRSKITMKDCLEKFRLPEILDEENTWYCGNCKKHVRATKTLEIWKLPQTLILHLKRFQQRGRFFEKADDLVDFPLLGLDMTPYHLSEQQEASRTGKTPEKCIYDCIAVVNHSGNTWGGHYYAYANHDMAIYGPSAGPGKWYRFDDSYVSPMDDPEREVVTRGAYLLVYRRRPNNITVPDNLMSNNGNNNSSSSLHDVE